jgi:hypothetical protein
LERRAESDSASGERTVVEEHLGRRIPDQVLAVEPEAARLAVQEDPGVGRREVVRPPALGVERERLQRLLVAAPAEEDGNASREHEADLPGPVRSPGREDHEPESREGEGGDRARERRALDLRPGLDLRPRLDLRHRARLREQADEDRGQRRRRNRPAA